jgi:hypothetical protein
MVDFDRHRLSFLDENEITLISHDVFTSLGKASSPAARGLLAEVIDKLGAASAKAQGYQVSHSSHVPTHTRLRAIVLFLSHFSLPIPSLTGLSSRLSHRPQNF